MVTIFTLFFEGFLKVCQGSSPTSPSTSTRSKASPFLSIGLDFNDMEAAVEEADTAVAPAGLMLHCPLSTLSFLSLESCSLVETPTEGEGLGVLEYKIRVYQNEIFELFCFCWL